jgi:hypothetical protein
VEVLRQLQVFDDITALIDSQPVMSFCLFVLLGLQSSRHALQASVHIILCSFRNNRVGVKCQMLCGGVAAVGSV